MTARLFNEEVSLSRARADLGPLARWVGVTRSRVALTSRGTVAAVLVSPAELTELDQQAGLQRRPGHRAARRSQSGAGTS